MPATGHRADRQMAGKLPRAGGPMEQPDAVRRRRCCCCCRRHRLAKRPPHHHQIHRRRRRRRRWPPPSRASAQSVARAASRAAAVAASYSSLMLGRLKSLDGALRLFTLEFETGFSASRALRVSRRPSRARYSRTRKWVVASSSRRRPRPLLLLLLLQSDCDFPTRESQSSLRRASPSARPCWRCASTPRVPPGYRPPSLPLCDEQGNFLPGVSAVPAKRVAAKMWHLASRRDSCDEPLRELLEKAHRRGILWSHPAATSEARRRS